MPKAPTSTWARHFCPLCFEKWHGRCWYISVYEYDICVMASLFVQQCFHTSKTKIFIESSVIHVLCVKNIQVVYILRTGNHDDVIKWKYFPRHWPFVREFTGLRWIPRTKASDAELWCFLWYVHELTVEQTIARLVIWDAISPIMTSL